jgi:hypothetical protein
VVEGAVPLPNAKPGLLAGVAVLSAGFAPNPKAVVGPVAGVVVGVEDPNTDVVVVVEGVVVDGFAANVPNVF